MRNALLLLFVTAFAFLPSHASDAYRKHIDLQGIWQFSLDPDSSITSETAFSDWIDLPGTTDTNRKGTPAINKNETMHLTRLFYYVGKAWYKKKIEIPDNWKRKQIYLFLERTKPTKIYVDGKFAGRNNNISTPQIYDLTSFLFPGSHAIAIQVDNGSGVPKQIYGSHAYSEDTQTNWNGIIGKIELEAVNPLHIVDIKIDPNTVDNQVAVSLSLSGKITSKNHIILRLSSLCKNDYRVDSLKLSPDKGENRAIDHIIIPLGHRHFWSEFHPDLYHINVEISGVDSLGMNFGMVNFRAGTHKFIVNGHPTFLRGKHDGCVFPLIGHTAMDVETWRKYFRTAKTYGINHYRFHSWCPPEACFEAADMEGVYLQPELPFWGDFDKKDTCLMRFLKKEGMNILKTYGNHPSFVMLALGNELSGDISEMRHFVDDFRKADSRHLYTFGSNGYLGYKPIDPDMDYCTTCRIGGEEKNKFNTHTRGSFSFADAYDGGYINHCYPNTIMDFSGALKASSIPVISHETGQFQSYPDFNEIKEYTGVLYPYNMEVFRRRLKDAGMLQQASDFHKASGLWAAELYKADIEMDLRTRNLAGFHLLDLQDYPGQGSSYVGILNAFMENKGFITPEAFRQFCCPVVPLLLMKKFCYTNCEVIRAVVKIANYSENALQNKTLSWRITDNSNKLYHESTVSIPNDSIGLFSVGDITVDLSDINKPEKLTFSLSVDGTDYSNSYPLWVYPQRCNLKSLTKDIVITDSITAEVEKELVSGARVLLMPKSDMNTVGGLFQTDYWNYRMFKTICENNHCPVSPGTLGILTDPGHPIFNSFPTDCHTDWQWFPVIKASHPFILDGMPEEYFPIVQVIDNVERNHKLGLIFEMGVGKGRLLVCMSPLDKLVQYPEARQLYYSVLEYMHSSNFKPALNLSLMNMKRLFTTVVSDRKVSELHNISYK